MKKNREIILFMEVSNEEIIKEILVTPKREGFAAVEWVGTEIK